MSLDCSVGNADWRSTSLEISTSFLSVRSCVREDYSSIHTHSALLYRQSCQNDWDDSGICSLINNINTHISKWFGDLRVSRPAHSFKEYLRIFHGRGVHIRYMYVKIHAPLLSKCVDSLVCTYRRTMRCVRDIAFDEQSGPGKPLVGSCCTMVAERMLEYAPDTLTSDVSRLLLGAVSPASKISHLVS